MKIGGFVVAALASSAFLASAAQHTRSPISASNRLSSLTRSSCRPSCDERQLILLPDDTGAIRQRGMLLSSQIDKASIWSNLTDSHNGDCWPFLRLTAMDQLHYIPVASCGTSLNNEMNEAIRVSIGLVLRGQSVWMPLVDAKRTLPTSQA